MRWAPLWTTLSVLALSSTAWADPFTLISTRTGNIQYVFVGAALADNANLNNGVNCLLQSASATVKQSMLSANPKLQQGTLFISGSLIGDTLDYPVNNLALFDPNSSASAAELELAAQAAAATTVKFQPPGATGPTIVSLTEGVPYVSVYNIAGGPTPGNVGFFTTPIDVTSVINNEGQGLLTGTYTVTSTMDVNAPTPGNVLSDVCFGVEAVCNPNTPSNPNCSTVSAVHTNGTASFGLLLVYEDLALPLYSVSLFEGMQQLSGTSQTLSLVTGEPFSNPSVGSLTYYVIEGDLTIQGSEYVFVQVPTPGAPPGIYLNDADNPNGNIYNGTLNFEPTSAPPYAGCPNVFYCCGPDVCGLAGIDIDTYDISPALQAGATQIGVTISTGSDRIALASVVLGAQLYEALLKNDTQFRTFGTVNNAAQVGNTVTYSLAISNTGNLPASNVQVSFDAPAGITNFQVLSYPQGATATVSPSGGVNQTGTAQFGGFNVTTGQIQEIRFVVTTQCNQVGQTLDVLATISGSNVTSFTTAAPTLTVGGPGSGPCAGLDPSGPFSGVDPVHSIRGGGGGGTCAAAPASLWFCVLALGARRRRRGASLLVVGMLATSIGACGKQHPGSAAPQPQALTSTNDLPGTPCATESLMVQVTPSSGTAFCIDRFEASLDGGALGNAVQSSDDTVTTLDGSTQAKAQVALGVAPTTNISWWQAVAACQNAGKHLCQQTEWEAACRGAAGYAYPYGNTVNETACNGFFDFNPTNPANTGSFKQCVSSTGAYDLSGNVAEWLDTAVTRTPDSNTLNDRATHGGSYASNDAAIACVGVQFHSPPGTQEPTIGFRCCK